MKAFYNLGREQLGDIVNKLHAIGQDSLQQLMLCYASLTYILKYARGLRNEVPG